MEASFIPFTLGFDFSWLWGKRKIFIIHGHDEDNLLKLKAILNTLNLTPIVLIEYSSFNSKSIIEQFEEIAGKCRFVIALYTKDDLIKKDDEEYYQARPNVIFEIGWFCERRGRKNMLILVDSGAKIFSNFKGIRTMNFEGDINKIADKIRIALQRAGISN